MAPKKESEEQIVFHNAEMSRLTFVGRVIKQARSKKTPLLERLNFLCISSMILDEFYEIRVASIKERARVNAKAAAKETMDPIELLKQISLKAKDLVALQRTVLEEELWPALKKESIELLSPKEWDQAQEAWITDYFRTELLPILSPLGLDPAHPFPQILNKSLNFMVALSGKDVFGRNLDVAILPAPRSLPRIIKLPEEVSGGKEQFVTLASVIQHLVHEFFHNMEVKGVYQFRMTRNSNLFYEEEEVQDLMNTLEGELQSRRYGDVVRLEVEENIPIDMLHIIKSRFKFEDDEIFPLRGVVNLHCLAAMYSQSTRQDLKNKPYTSQIPKELGPGADLFASITKKDILLHLPYQSFSPVLDLLRTAAKDPNVLVIKQTLYRTGIESVMVDYLVEAALDGKEVTVVVELKARFDEAANIALANRLQEAGVHVVYGVVGYKTHAKMLMIVRREKGKLVRYVHLGTGNYHAKTAKLYTDFGLFTANKDIGEDVHNLFMQLTGLGKGARLKKLLQAPFTLRSSFKTNMENEVAQAKAGKKAIIRAKINALTDYSMIEELVKAARAGVKVELIVRGACILSTKGLKNIRVISFVGRFLEHHRAYYFYDEGREKVFISSADLMFRNLSRRIEVAAPILDEDLKKRVIHEAFTVYLKPNTGAFTLNEEGEYDREKDSEDTISPQEVLLKVFKS